MVTFAAVILNGFVAAVFVLSGVQKLRDPQSAALAIRNFRLATRLHPALGASLGVLEFCLAAAMGLTGDRPSHIAAMVLVAAFIVLLIAAVKRGEMFHCGCFGARDSLGASPSRALLRTTALQIALVLLVAADGFADTSRWERVHGVLAGSLLLSAAILSQVALQALARRDEPGTVAFQ